MLPHNNDFRMDESMCFTMQYAPDPEEITVFVLEFGAAQTPSETVVETCCDLSDNSECF